MVSKYGHFMLPEVFPDNVIRKIDFTDQEVVQCHVPVAKLIF